MSKHYYHPVLKQELKQTEQYQDQIDKIWGAGAIAPAQYIKQKN